MTARDYELWAAWLCISAAAGMLGALFINFFQTREKSEKKIKEDWHETLSGRLALERNRYRNEQ